MAPSPLARLSTLRGRTSLFWTARALAQSRRVRRVRVVCESGEEAAFRPELPDDARFEFEVLPPGSSKAAEEDQPLRIACELHRLLARSVRRPSLFLTCATPLLSGATLDALFSGVEEANFDSAAVYVRDSLGRAAWGEATPEPMSLLGEPLHLLRAGVIGPGALDGALEQIERFAPELEQLMSAQNFDWKTLLSGGKVARTLGIGFSLRLIRRKASVPETERVASRLLGCRVGLLECQDADVLLCAGNPKHRALLEERLR